MTQPTNAFLLKCGTQETLVVPDLFFFEFKQVETYPDPWAQEIARILLPLPNFDPDPNDSQECYEFRAWIDRICILDWTIKCKWDSTRKPIFPRKNRLYKPLGEFWRTVIDLCMECHSKDLEYPDSASWFSAIFCEYQLVGRSTNSGKDDDITGFQAENAALRKFEPGEFNNPFDAKATRRLIAIATRKAHSQDVFLKERYRPFLKARSALVKLYKLPEFCAIREINGEMFGTVASRHKMGNKAYRKIGVG
jgi:hypothetical protein